MKPKPYSIIKLIIMTGLMTACASTNAQEVGIQSSAKTKPVVISFSHPKRATISGAIKKYSCHIGPDKTALSVKINTDYIRAANSEIISLSVTEIFAGSMHMPSGFIDRINERISTLGGVPRLTPYCENGTLTSIMLSISPNEVFPTGIFHIIMRDPNAREHNP